MELTDAQLSALRAIAEDRVPAEEALRAKLKRLGLIERRLFDKSLGLTDAGREALQEASR